MTSQTVPARTTLYNLLLSKARVEALTDGIFAIAMTLLVLELKIPELPKSTGNAELLHKIGEQAPVFLSFLISFLYCGLLWIWHHFAMHFIRQMQLVLVWLNLLFLMSISVMPFSCGLLGHFLRNRAADEIYFGNLFVAAALLLAQWLVAKKKKLVVEDDPQASRLMGQRLMFFPVAMAGGMIATIFNAGAGPYAFIVVLLAFRIWQRRQAAQATTPGPSS